LNVTIVTTVLSVTFLAAFLVAVADVDQVVKFDAEYCVCIVAFTDFICSYFLFVLGELGFMQTLVLALHDDQTVVVAGDQFAHRAADQEVVETGQTDAVLLLVFDAQHAEAIPAEGLAEAVLTDGSTGLLSRLHLYDAPVVELLYIQRTLPHFVFNAFVQLFMDLHDAELPEFI